MNQIVYYRQIFFILGLILISPIEAKLLKPSKNGSEKEILIVNGKRRLYHVVRNKNLTYSVQGPSRVEFISRYPVIRKKKNSHPFQYTIVINDKDTVNVKHRYKVQRTIRSVQHPEHSYTFSGNYFINLEKGSHIIQLLKENNQKYPVLIRLLTKEFEDMGIDKEVLKPMVHKNAVELLINGKKINYYECSPKLPLQIEARGEKKIRVITRLQFSDIMGDEESYRLKVSEGKKIIGTYYFSTERSSLSEIEGRRDKVPGKWRSCEFPVSKGSHRYNLEVLDKNKVVFTRFILY
tara:strand:- start:40633 stop:41511 length:879 start_codon:yes stop_codon:yes gene_type:complete